MTEDDIKRKRGKGSKPKGKRRKRVKKREEPVREEPRGGGEVPSRPIHDRIEWKTRKPLPMYRSLGEASMPSLGLRPSGKIPRSNMMEVNGELEKLTEERKALEGISERMDKQEKKLVVLVTDLRRAEERMNSEIGKLDARIRELGVDAESLNSMLMNLSTLLSRMETLLSHYEVIMRRTKETIKEVK